MLKTTHYSIRKTMHDVHALSGRPIPPEVIKGGLAHTVTLVEKIPVYVKIILHEKYPPL